MLEVGIVPLFGEKFTPSFERRVVEFTLLPNTIGPPALELCLLKIRGTSSAFDRLNATYRTGLISTTTGQLTSCIFTNRASMAFNLPGPPTSLSTTGTKVHTDTSIILVRHTLRLLSNKLHIVHQFLWQLLILYTSKRCAPGAGGR